MIPALVIGIYLIIVGFMGNAYCTYKAVLQQGGFIKWIAAVLILWAIWEYAPDDLSKPIRALIIVSITGFIIVNYGAVDAQISGLWNSISTLGTSNKGAAKNGLG